MTTYSWNARTGKVAESSKPKKARKSSRKSGSKKKPRKAVKPHKRTSKLCGTCGHYHTKSQHWSHKANTGKHSYKKSRGVGAAKTKSGGPRKKKTKSEPPWAKGLRAAKRARAAKARKRKS